jgi:putative addiction module component (TIGR02574 family)
MTDAAERILREAESLSDFDRAEIAYALIRTLNLESESLDEEFRATLQRRVSEIRSGKVVGIPAEIVFRNARERLQ